MSGEVAPDTFEPTAEEDLLLASSPLRSGLSRHHSSAALCDSLESRHILLFSFTAWIRCNRCNYPRTFSRCHLNHRFRLARTSHPSREFIPVSWTSFSEFAKRLFKTKYTAFGVFASTRRMSQHTQPTHHTATHPLRPVNDPQDTPPDSAPQDLIVPLIHRSSTWIVRPPGLSAHPDETFLFNLTSPCFPLE